MSEPMRDAAFIQRQIDSDGGRLHAYVPTAHGADGVQFDCPCGRGHVLTIWFENPLGRARLPQPGWTRTGETLETLTLAPSIAVRAGPAGTDCWHGYVRNGRIEDAEWPAPAPAEEAP